MIKHSQEYIVIGLCDVVFLTFICRADFDLDSERSKLDEQGLQIGESQESSLKNRRKLAESTRGIVSFPFSSVYITLAFICSISERILVLQISRRHHLKTNKSCFHLCLKDIRRK